MISTFIKNEQELRERHACHRRNNLHLNVCNISLVIHCDATPNIDTRFLRLHQLLPPYKVRMVIFIPFPDYVTFLFRLLMYF